MDELFLLYLWTRLDAINEILQGITAIGFLITFFGATFYIISSIFAHHEEFDTLPQGAYSLRQMITNKKKWLWIPIIAVALQVVIPTKQEAAIIAGGWGILEISKNEDVQEISNDTLQLIKQKLDKQLKQAKDNVTKESK